MNNNVQVTGDLLMELEELKKVDVKPDAEGPYSITFDYGGVLSIICC